MTRFRNRTLLWITAIIAIIFILKKGIFPSIAELLKPKPVVIDETPLLIKEIKAIGQLVTYTSFDEVVVDSTVVTAASVVTDHLNRIIPIPVIPSAKKELVIIGRGKVNAGVDLHTLDSSSISFKNDTLIIRLPKATILDAIINPSGFETFQETGRWSDSEVILVKQKAKRKIIDRALERGLLPKADEKATVIIENFLKDLGYKNIIVVS